MEKRIVAPELQQGRFAVERAELMAGEQLQKLAFAVREPGTELATQPQLLPLWHEHVAAQRYGGGQRGRGGGPAR